MADSEATTPADRTADEHRRIVRERYASIATNAATEDCCADGDSADEECCADSGGAGEAGQFGYDESAIEGPPADGNLGLGCGNPQAIAAMESGETVLDLGSGAGFDCFLAADAVGPEGTVIGVDMTPEMVTRARETATENGLGTVEFRLGEIEHLPVADATVDVVISNCVVNLSPDKPQVFAEAFRALRPGGRLAIADVVQTAPIPEDQARDPNSLAACVAGAATIEDLREMLADAGFRDIEIAPKGDSETFIREWADGYDPSDFLVSATIQAHKPTDQPPGQG